MLTDQQLDNDFARVNRVEPSPSLQTALHVVDQTEGDAAALKFIASTPSWHATEVVLTYELATGAVPTLQQEAGWTDYLDNGGTLQSMVDAFVKSDAFAQHFGVWPDITNPEAPAGAVVADQVVFIATGQHATAEQTSVWAGESVDVLIADFVQNDTYVNRTEPHVVAYFDDSLATYNGIVGSHYDSGDLFSV
jgi:hypothetical protein